jgi:hypothetical protein
MKLKPSLKNLIKSALLFVNLSSLLISGCSYPNEPTYKEKDIPGIIKKICKEEYNLNVTTQRTGGTLWIYAPVEQILHKDYATDQSKIFDEKMLDKLRNILITVGRVLISSDTPPQFFALLVSDTILGIDYRITGNTLDIKKGYAGFIPEEESNRRYIVKFLSSPEAIGDKTGFHFTPYDITITEFLKEQISQRIAAYFQNEKLKNYFKVVKSEGEFEDGFFSFEYSIEEIAKPKTKIKVRNEILKIIAYCLKTYEFNDFSGISIYDLRTDERLNFTKTEILSRPTDF